MNRFSLSDWIQVLTSVALLVGLLLVVYEIRQNHKISQVQMVSENLSAFMQHQLAISGENPAPVLYKACMNEPLTKEELIVFDVQARTYALYASRLLALDYLGDFESRSVQGEAANILGTLLSTSAGRAWWQLNRPFQTPAVRAAGDRASESGVAECRHYFERFQSLTSVEEAVRDE